MSLGDDRIPWSVGVQSRARQDERWRSCDAALLAEAAAEGRAFLTEDHDIGALVHRDSLPHCGVLLMDDLGDAAAESKLILASHHDQLAASAFLRAGAAGIRE